MKLLFLGDVVGRSGRDAVMAHLPGLRERHSVDATILNVENAAHGFGMTDKMCDEFLAVGVDVLSSGNHAWDKREIVAYISQQPRLLRPLNYPEGTPGQGVVVIGLANGKRLGVMNAMGRVHMDPLDCPFQAVEKVLKRYRLGIEVDAMILDFHAEATSEKMAMGHYLDGRVSMVVGTHTHVPTADAQILPKGTAYQSDAGMCGDYNSVIGFKPEVPISRFTRKMAFEKMSPAEGEGTVCGVVVTLDDKSGLAVRIEPVRVGARLEGAGLHAPGTSSV